MNIRTWIIMVPMSTWKVVKGSGEGTGRANTPRMGVRSGQEHFRNILEFYVEQRSLLQGTFVVS
jgi:hypothetical protein